MDEHKQYSKSELPICYEVKQDCTMYWYGVCRLLTSTHFRRGKCPFYKSWEQAEKDRIKTERRLAELRKMAKKGRK